MNTETILEDIGLTKNEIKIYMALLELGSTKTGQLIKKTELHTSKVYDGLERLANKGLVTHVIIANTKHFKAVNPNRLIDFLEDKQKIIAEQEKQIKQILPALQLKQQLAGDDTEAEIFQGWRGMETVYKLMRDTLKKGDMNYVFGASKGEDEEQVRTFFNKHAQLLYQKKVQQKIIFNESARGNIAVSVKTPKYCKIKHMQNTTPAEINIWKDNTMIVILTKKPTVVLIKNPKVADSFRKYFEIMWLIAKK